MSLPAEKPVVEDGGIKLFDDEVNAAELSKAANGNKSLAAYLMAHLARVNAGDYFALLGYIQMNAENEASLQSLRHLVRDKKRVATCFGLRSALPAFDWTGLQGRIKLGSVPANHLRRFRRATGSRPEIQFRNSEGGTGARRFPGVG